MKEKYVLRGPPLSVATINESSGKFLYKRLCSVNKGIAFLNEKTNESITYSELFESVCRLAVSLRNFGLTSENTLAVCSENSVNYIIPVIAGIFEGIPVVPINPTYTEYEFTHAFNLTRPSIIFCSKNNVRLLCNLKHKFACIKAIVVLSHGEEAVGLSQFMLNYSPSVNIDEYSPADVDIDNHVALIMFSSGTTGLPKGVMISHKNFNTRRAIMLDPNYAFQPTIKVTLGVLPFFHIFGLNTVITGLMYGRMVVVLEKFDPMVYLTCIEKYKIEAITAPPAVMQFLAKSPLIDKFNLSHVKDIVVGSAPISQALEEEVKKRISIKYVRQGYSMTEGTATIVVTPANTERLGSCGKLYPTIIGVIKDTETGENLGPRMVGELCFKGGTIMKGYYKNEAATKETFTKDGYLRTGDVGYYDEDEYFYVVDRMKELIKYKGYQVAPAELESILIAHKKIKDVAVVGIPDAEAGELPMAFVVKQPDVHLTEDEVKSFLSKYVSRNKYLHGGVKFIDAIPRNSLSKIVRKEVKNMAINELKSKL